MIAARKFDPSEVIEVSDFCCQWLLSHLLLGASHQWESSPGISGSWVGDCYCRNGNRWELLMGKIAPCTLLEVQGYKKWNSNSVPINKWGWIFCYSGSYVLRAAPDKNVWPLHSQSACSQVFAVLFYARTAKFVWTQTCDGDMHDEIGKNLPLAEIYHWYPKLHAWIGYVYDQTM